MSCLTDINTCLLLHPWVGPTHSQEEEVRRANVKATLAKTGKIINNTAKTYLKSNLRACFESWKQATTGWRNVGGTLRSVRSVAAICI